MSYPHQSVQPEQPADSVQPRRADWQLSQLLPAARIELSEGRYIEAFSVMSQLLSSVAHQSSPGPWLWDIDDHSGPHDEALRRRGQECSLLVSQPGEAAGCPSDGALIALLSTPEVAHASAAMFSAAALELTEDRRAVVGTAEGSGTVTEEAESQASALQRSTLSQHALPLLEALLRGEA